MTKIWKKLSEELPPNNGGDSEYAYISEKVLWQIYEDSEESYTILAGILFLGFFESASIMYDIEGGHKEVIKFDPHKDYPGQWMWREIDD